MLTAMGEPRKHMIFRFLVIRAQNDDVTTRFIIREDHRKSIFVLIFLLVKKIYVTSASMKFLHNRQIEVQRGRGRYYIAICSHIIIFLHIGIHASLDKNKVFL